MTNKNAQTLAGRRVVIYVRTAATPNGIINPDLAIVRQEEACREFIAWHGGEVVGTYEDAGPYPVRLGKRYRPQFEAMLGAMHSGQFQAVVMYDHIRLGRTREDYIRYSTIAEAAGITTVFVKENLTPSPRPFGYLRSENGWVISAPEAAVIRSAIRALLDGVSLRTIAEEWNAAELRTPDDALWSALRVQNLLTCVRNAGVLEHNGQIVGQSVFPAIITVDQLTAIRAELEN